jgi:L-lactate dehydrogenase complex protein LldE
MLISLFITCYNDMLFPATGKAVVAVLEQLGHSVEFRPAQTCCGQMHYNTGYEHHALELMHYFLKVFQDSEVICAPSASCVAMVRDHFPVLAAHSEDAEVIQEVKNLLPRVFEFSELLVDKLGVQDVGANFPHRVTYHPSCHSLRSLKLADKPVQLLKHVRGLEFVELPNSAECCGFGGTFAVKNAEVSGAMLSEKIQCLQGTEAEICAAADNSCLMHIRGGMSRQRMNVKCMHLAEILAAKESGAME